MTQHADVHRIYCEATGKRCYRSVAGARSAMRKASNTIRCYRCQHCSKIHVTNRERNGR